MSSGPADGESRAVEDGDDAPEPMYPDDIELASAARVEAARSILADLGHDAAPNWTFPRGRGRATTSYESFQRLTEMPGAPHLLALLQAYAEAVGLADIPGAWAASALPRWSNMGGVERGATISVGPREVFSVDVTADSGSVVWWGAVIDSQVNAPYGTSGSLNDDGSTVIDGDDLRSLLSALADQDFATALRDVCSARSHQKRRAASRNPWLGALVVGETAQVVPSDAAAAPEQIERRYAERVVQQRLHQRDFKLLLLKTYPACCAYCGLAVPEVLDAAHLVADAEGGAPTAENGRLLCANHHRAFDRQLLEWTGRAFVPTNGAAVVPPLPPKQRT